MKAIIFDGGVGTRLHRITHSQTPKGFIDFFGHPLIARQILLIQKFGIREVIIAVRTPYEADQFENLIKKRLVPKLTYHLSFDDQTTLALDHTHPFFNFRSQKTLSLLKGSDFIAINGDNIFSESLLADLFSQHKQYGETVLAKHKTNQRVPFVVHNWGSEIRGVTFLERAPEHYWAYDICGTSLFDQSDLDLLRKISQNDYPHIAQFISLSLRQRRRMRLVEANFFINMNEYEDYAQAYTYFKSLQEPTPYLPLVKSNESTF